MSQGPLRVVMTLEQCWHRVPGGTATAALGLARALRDDAALELAGVAAAHRQPPPTEWQPPIPVRHLPLPRALLYESWHVLRRPRVGAADVIHATGLAMPPRTAPIVYTIHDLAFRHYPEHFTRAGLRFFEQGIRLARREADLVLCSSRATLEDCRAAGFDEQRLRHVPLGVEIRPASAEDVERVRGRYSLDRPYVLWAGTLEPRKNLPRLLDAFGGIDIDAELVLVGPRGWKEQLERRPRVRLLGFVPRADLDALYAGAAVFCFPSLLEGFGFPVLEAMAQGTPVVTSRGTSTEELAADGAGLLVDPHEPAEIAAALERALTESDELRSRGRRRAAEYTWKRTAELTKAAYIDAAGL